MKTRKRPKRLWRSTPLWLGWWCSGLVLCSLLLWSAPCHAEDKTPAIDSWNLYGGLRFNFAKDALDYGTPPAFREGRLGGSLLLGFSADIKFHPQAEMAFNVDIGELSINQVSYGPDNYFGIYLNNYDLQTTPEVLAAQQADVEQCRRDAQAQGVSTAPCEVYPFYLQESFFLRELYFRFYFNKQKWAKMHIGMYNKTMGRAFLLDNYVLGVHVEFDWTKRSKKARLPIRLELDAFLPDSSFTPEGKMSPVFSFKLSYVPSSNFHLSLFGAYMYDGNDLAGKLMLPLWKELFANQFNQFVAKRAGQATNFLCSQVNGPRRQDISLRKPGDLSREDVDKLNEDINKQDFDSSDIDTLKQTFPDPQSTKERGTAALLGSLIDICSTMPSSQGHHAWLGLEGKWQWKNKLTIEGSAMLYVSSMTIGLPRGAKGFRRIARRTRFNPSQSPRDNPATGQTQQPLTAHDTLTPHQSTADEGDIRQVIQDKPLQGLGFLGELNVSYKWIPSLQTSAFFLFSSGDRFRDDSPSVSHAFMGIAPQVRYTNIFFNGGINAYSSKRGISINGVSGRGYIAPGLSIIYQAMFKDEEERAKIKLTGAAYWSMHPPVFTTKDSTSGTFYGAELNLVSSYTFRLAQGAGKWITLKPVAQVDLFFPGSFFAATGPPPFAFQLLAGVDFSW